MESFETEVRVNNSDGIHLRPSGAIAEFCNKFINSNISISSNGNKADGKNALDINLLCAGFGSILKINVTDQDAEPISKEIALFIRCNFVESSCEDRFRACLNHSNGDPILLARNLASGDYLSGKPNDFFYHYANLRSHQQKEQFALKFISRLSIHIYPTVKIEDLNNADRNEAFRERIKLLKYGKELLKDPNEACFIEGTHNNLVVFRQPAIDSFRTEIIRILESYDEI